MKKTEKWPNSLLEAKKIQEKLRLKVKIISLAEEPSYIASADASFCQNVIIAVSTVYKYPELDLLETSYAIEELSFPYIPGFLTLREGPAIFKAIQRLNIHPQLILFDGQGIAHPRGLGIASHLGVLLDIPSIGVAKKKLIGHYEEPKQIRGHYSFLFHLKKPVGAVLRTKKNVKPVFISPGHRMDIPDSVRIVMNCTGKYRLPIPIREVDGLTKKMKRMLNVDKV